MAKKSFRNNPAMAFIDTPQATDEPAATSEKEARGTQKSHYRVNLRLNPEYKEYLDRVSWENKKSITQYINDLIEADKATRDVE